MLNLASLNLDHETHFLISEVLFRHHKADINDFESDLIMALLSNKTLKQEMDELNNHVCSLDNICHNALDDAMDAVVKANSALNKAISCESKLNETDLIIHLADIVKRYREKELNLITTSSMQVLRLKKHVQEIVQALNEIMDFITTDKTINLRNKKTYTNRAILNLRTKINAIDKIIEEKE